MAITFDPIAKRIILDSVAVTPQELYSRSADWLALSDNSKYGPVFEVVGGDDLGSGLSIPFYFFLQNTWKVRPMEADQHLIITGNLFTTDNSPPVVSPLGHFNVVIEYVVPVLAQGISTTGAPVPTVTEIANAVWDHISGASIEKILMNKVTKVGDTITILDDDGVTTWKQYDLTGGARIPL